MKRLLAMGLLLAILSAFAPSGEVELRWYDLNTAVAKAKRENKKVWIHVYTDWCAWCKIMDKQAYSDPKVVSYLNRKFVPVKLDAWSKTPIQFEGKEFGFEKEISCNTLAYSLLDGKMAYPTTVIMSEKAEILSPVPGYLDRSMMKKLLVYFGENVHQTMEWEYFKKKYDY